MYDIFNSFLDVETWYKDNPFDNERFYSALSEVVLENDFSPDSMADHMRSYKNVSHDDNTEYSRRIEDLQSAAWHIKDYLKFIS